MKKVLPFKLVIVLVTIASVIVILNYLLIFVFKIIDYQYGIAFALFLLAFLICIEFLPKIKDRKKFLRESLILLASLLHHTCALLVTIIFKLEIVLLLVVVMALGFLVSIFTVNFKRSITYACFSLIVGSIITILLLLSPLMLSGQMWQINYVLEPVIHSVMRLLPFSFVFSFFGTILGNFIIEAF